MKVYGLRIGSVGIEFPSRDDRDKAILTFTRGSSVEINNGSGPRYRPGEESFATYERDDSQQISNCEDCRGQFLTETCSSRTVPSKTWEGKFTGMDTTATLCDGCYAKRLREKEVADAKKTVAAAEASSV